jgi:hypothetical protein
MLYASKNPAVCDHDVGIKEAVPAVLAAAAVQIMMNVAASELESYLSEKQKEFSFTYNGNINMPYYYLRSGPNEYNRIIYNCLLLTRYMPNQLEAKEDDGKREAVFEWKAGLVPSASGAAIMIKTVDLKLRKAGARTGKDSNKIDLKVEAKIDSTTHNEKGEIVTTTVADKTLSYPGVTISDQSNANDRFRKIESTWFPPIPRSPKEAASCDILKERCAGISPVSISVSVTETGSGGASFGDLGKEIADNKKTLGDAINKAITDALKPPSTSGSSK